MKEIDRVVKVEFCDVDFQVVFRNVSGDAEVL